MIRAIISDFDGTLCDTQKAISTVLEETFRAGGRPVPARDAIHATLAKGITLEQTFAELAPELEAPDACQTWVKTYREIYNGGLGVRSTLAFEGAALALGALAEAGVPVIIVSNKGELAVENTLRHLELDRHVHTIVAAKGDLATKPDPRSFAERIAPLFPELEPADFLVVGDTPTDIHYARAVGAQSAWVSFGYGASEACRTLGPDYVIERLPDLARLVAMAQNDAPDLEQQAPGLCILSHIGRAGPLPRLVTYIKAFSQPGISRPRAQAMISKFTRNLLTDPRAGLTRPDLLVPIARAGLAMWPAANAYFDGPPTCFAIGKKEKGSTNVEVHLSTGLHQRTRSVLVMDTVCATGDTVVAAARALRQRAPQARIEVALGYAAPDAVTTIRQSGFVDHLLVGVLATGCDAGWLVPRINGDAGEKLFGWVE